MIAKPNIAKRIVRSRLMIERGIKFVAPLVSSLTAVGVWRVYLPDIPWVWLWVIGVSTYLIMAWCLGWVDERWLWRPETEMYSERNPQLMNILETVQRIEERLNHEA